MSWNDLSMQEKAEIMRLAVQDGVYNLDSIRDGYNEYAKGGSIHIKPENRGKFTALKKRTGHSATWFKQHGTPAQKKMATFALNARKWKHGLGGNLFDGTSQSTQKMNIGLNTTNGWRPYTFGEIVTNGERVARQREALEEAMRNFQIESNDATSIAGGKPQNTHLEGKAIRGGAANAAWEKEHPNLTAWGNVLGAVPFAVAAAPAGAWGLAGISALGDATAATSAGQAITSGLAPLVSAASTNAYGVPFYTWADAGLTSLFGGHGVQTAIDEGGVSPMTALEVAPLGRLAKPIWNTGKGEIRSLVSRPKTVNTIPQITAENTASITPEQWDAAYRAAYERGDTAEGQRLWGLWFKQKAPNTKQANPMFNASGESTFNRFNGGKTGLNWFSESKEYAANHGIPRAFYINEPDIYFGNVPAWIKGAPANERYVNSLKKLGYTDEQIAQKVQEINKAAGSTAPAAKSIGMGINNELVTKNNNTIKLADPFTLADDGSLIPLTKRADFSNSDIRYLKGTDIQGNEYELPVRTMRGGVKDINGNIISDIDIVNNFKRSQDFYKMRLRSRGLKQPGKTLKTDYDTMFAELQKRFPDATAEEVEAYIKNSGGGFAIPEVGFGAVDKKLNTIGKQMKGTTNNAKIHEDSHLMGTPTEEITWSNILDINLGEAAARGTQIKSVLGIKDGTPITGEQLKYMKDNFVRLTNVDNNMQAFLDSITDFDSAADWLSRNSYSMGGAFNLLNYDFLKYPFGGFGL